MPRVESLAESGLVAVHLMDLQEFDPDEFDDLVRQMAPNRMARLSMRFIAVNDIMAITPDWVGNHLDVFTALLRPRFGDRLNSAGYADIMLAGDYESYPQRGIYDSSSTLAAAGLLRKEESDHYKLEVMKPKLEPHFQVD